jgi:hypothetical protein
MFPEDIDYGDIYDPEPLPGSDEIPDEDDIWCIDCGAPAKIVCHDCGILLCGQCLSSHEAQHHADEERMRQGESH